MEKQEALALVQDILAPRVLSDVEQLVITQSWEGKGYREIALAAGYEEGYLKDVGYRLWQALSDSLGCRVTKKKLRYLIMEAVQPQSPKVVTPVPLKVPASANVDPEIPTSTELGQALEYPGSPLAFGSPLYIQRPPAEELAISAMQHPGGLLRIKAPWRMGKTSLMNHLLGQCQQLGQHTVMVDLRQADSTALANLDAFFRWFCWSVSQQLNLPCELDNYWFEDAGSKLNCTTYIQENILAQVKAPIVIAIDTGHYLVEHPLIAKNFFSMLRSWYEQARVRSQWQKLRLILAYVADLDIPLQAHQSPFNIGLLVELPYFNWSQIQQLEKRHKIGAITTGETVTLRSLADFVGGHPYLMQLAFYWLQSGQLSVAQILRTAATNQGIYHEHLRRLWSAIHQEEALPSAFHQVLVSSGPIQLNPKQAYALTALGLVELIGHQVKLRCELYRDYFSPLLELECGQSSTINHF
ncbi:MAG: AAA-like domain-containing protein [Leptolyngbyaceae cyanobacterium]